MTLYEPEERAYEHNGDRELLERLGLRYYGFKRKHTDLGTVKINDATVRVEVAALPAQFWRFTVVVPDEEHASRVRRYVLNTGTGGFTTFWPMVEEIARHMVVIECEDL